MPKSGKGMRERYEPCRRRAIWAARSQAEERRYEEEEREAETVLKPIRRYTCKVCGEHFSYPLALARHSKVHQ